MSAAPPDPSAVPRRRPPVPEFVILAPGYNPNVGGFIVLHYLCHLLNELGHTAHLVPLFRSFELSPVDPDVFVQAILEPRASLRRTPYTLHPDWNTPLYRRPLRGIRKREEVVAVYPEVTFGNPLRARHVARWLLHTPGFHNKDVFFVPGEVQFRYLEMHKPVPMPWIEVAEQMLTVTYLPWESYQPPPEGSPRSGTAYLMRKGAGRSIVHDLSDSVCIDGMSHQEIGDIFRRVQTFISYDTRTSYSLLAAVAGADSVIVPEDGVDEDQWLPEEHLRVGLAYGFDRLDWARSTRHLAAERFQEMQTRSADSAADFARFWTERLAASVEADSATEPG